MQALILHLNHKKVDIYDIDGKMFEKKLLKIRKTPANGVV